MEQIELTKEITDSTDRLLSACEKIHPAGVHDWLGYLLNMIEQCNNKEADAPALAMHYILKGNRDGIFPTASAIPLAELYAKRIALEIERMKLAELRKANDDVKALMGICTAGSKKFNQFARWASGRPRKSETAKAGVGNQMPEDRFDSCTRNSPTTKGRKMIPTNRPPTRPWEMLVKEFGTMLQDKLAEMTPETAFSIARLTDTEPQTWISLANARKEWVKNRTLEQYEEARFSVTDADAAIRDKLEEIQDLMFQRKESLFAAYERKPC